MNLRDSVNLVINTKILRCFQAVLPCNAIMSCLNSNYNAAVLFTKLLFTHMKTAPKKTIRVLQCL